MDETGRLVELRERVELADVGGVIDDGLVKVTFTRDNAEVVRRFRVACQNLQGAGSLEDNLADLMFAAMYPAPARRKSC